MPGLLLVDRSVDRRRIAVIFTATLGAVVVACALDPWPWTLPALMLLAGLCMSVSNTSADTYMLTAVQAGLRGQAMSLYMMAMRGGASLGSLATGISVDLLGVRTALFVNGALAVALVLIPGRKLPKAAARAPVAGAGHPRVTDGTTGSGPAAFP